MESNSKCHGDAAVIFAVLLTFRSYLFLCKSPPRCCGSSCLLAFFPKTLESLSVCSLTKAFFTATYFFQELLLLSRNLLAKERSSHLSCVYWSKKCHSRRDLSLIGNGLNGRERRVGETKTRIHFSLSRWHRRKRKGGLERVRQAER